MVNWDTQTRGKNRQEENSPYERTDYDGLSCAEFEGVPLGAGSIRDVESLDLLAADRKP